MNLEKLEKILNENGEPRFRLNQILKAIYQDGVINFSEISNLPKRLREILDQAMRILPFRVEKIQVSLDRSSHKAVLECEDGNLVETVLLLAQTGAWSVCISSQIGCPMNCAFCATGEMGFKRNLTAEEISGQVLFWKAYLKENKLAGRITNIVYMGMGEPFLNWVEVKKSLITLIDKKWMNFGARSIAVSTVGVPGGMEKLLEDFPQVNLAISLHFVNEGKRQKFMPASHNFSLENLRQDLEKYFARSSRKVFLEYLLLEGLNNSEKDVSDLIKFVKSFKKQHLLHVNLIKYNETSGVFKKSPFYRTQKFKEGLLESGVNVTERKSLGEDVQGACGQLATENKK